MIISHLGESFASPLTSSGSLHLLAGCIQNTATAAASIDEMKCRATFVLDGSLHLTSGKVTLQAAHVFAGLPEVTSYSYVRVSLKANAGSFGGSDIIYTVNTLTGGVSAVHLKSNALLTTATLAFDSHGRSIIKQLSLTRMQNKPIVSVCTATSCVSSVLQVISPSKGSEDNKEMPIGSEELAPSLPFPTLSLKDLVSCSGDLSVILSTAQASHHPHTATMVACVALDKIETCGTNDKTCTQSAESMQSLTVNAKTDLTSSLTSSLQLAVTLEDSNVMLALGGAFSSHFVFQSSSSSSAQSNNGLKVLVRSSSGNLMYIQQSEVRQSEVRWVRSECLSRIQNNGVVMMDNQLSSYGAKSNRHQNQDGVISKRKEYLRMVENLSGLPTWSERLSMQKTDLMVRTTLHCLYFSLLLFLPSFTYFSLPSFLYFFPLMGCYMLLCSCSSFLG